MCLRRWILPVAILISLSHGSFAQSNDWAVVNHLVPGTKVRVQTTGGQSRVGRVESVTDDAIQIGKNQSIPRQDVQQVLLWSPGHHGRNALIGLGLGAGVGVVLGVASCGGRDPIINRGECVAVGTPFFGGIGAGIGALLPSRGAWRELYRSR